jgi:hypothetical protein
VILLTAESAQNTEMKNAILKSVQLGALASLLSASAYAVFTLIVAQASGMIIFGVNFFDYVFPFLLTSSPIWLLFPIVVGSVTAGIFGYIFTKYKPTKTKYILICTIFSTVETSPLIALFFILLADLQSGIYWFGVSHLPINPYLYYEMLSVFPSIIYIVASIFVSQQLYKSLSK